MLYRIAYCEYTQDNIVKETIDADSMLVSDNFLVFVRDGEPYVLLRAELVLRVDVIDPELDPQTLKDLLEG